MFFIQEFLSENSLFFENDNNINSSHDQGHKGILYKLISIKKKLSKRVEIISNSEIELGAIESRINLKLGNMSQEEREEFDKY